MFSNAAGAIYKSGKTWKVVKIVNKCRPCDLLLKITSACPNTLKKLPILPVIYCLFLCSLIDQRFREVSVVSVGSLKQGGRRRRISAITSRFFHTNAFSFENGLRSGAFQKRIGF